jgi:hypothetical protein
MLASATFQAVVLYAALSSRIKQSSIKFFLIHQTPYGKVEQIEYVLIDFEKLGDIRQEARPARSIYPLRNIPQCTKRQRQQDQPYGSI